jgi:hypothetical protein
MGHEVEAGPQRVRSHIRGPYPNKMITDQIRYTVYLTDPNASRATPPADRPRAARR